jgi:hypothetical protein
MAAVPAWSYSAVQGFETCPKRHYHIRVKKDFKDTFNAAADYGVAGHKHFENRIKNGTPLPMDLVHHEKVLKVFEAMKGEVMTEQRMALNKKFEPTGYFDSDVWVRGQADLIVRKGDDLLVVDYKFGKIKEGFDQLELMCAIAACYLPGATNFVSMFYWAKEKQTWTHRLTRQDLLSVWNNFLPRVEAFNLAHKTDDFPARPSGLCRNYCPVKTCPHNGAN